MPRKPRPGPPSVPRFLWDLLSRPDLSTLLTTLQLPTAPDHAAACAVVEAWLTQGTAAAVAVFRTHFGLLDLSALVDYDPQHQRVVSPQVYSNVRTALHWFLTTFATTKDARRLKRCPDPDCQQFFFDTTHNENKTYCSPHRLVRNRKRKRQERERHTQNAPAPRQPPC
jgi:predicted RNA-binding Zn ribbon-like protein